MTPQQHYDEAERLMAAAEQSVHNTTLEALTVSIRLAQVHATLSNYPRPEEFQ